MELVDYDLLSGDVGIFEGVYLLRAAEHLGTGVFLEIAGLEPHVEAHRFKFKVAFVGEGLDRRGKDHAPFRHLRRAVAAHESGPYIGNPGFAAACRSGEDRVLPRYCLKRFFLPLI
ncbi:hypothetical protein SDC9_151229 [bioreactor metagenome]|uniref:Uncharacterized protein n=1 Tax=bioreactor metagenome TaxID=1076179 RepID=A0A645EU01_9ZZZZ